MRYKQKILKESFLEKIKSKMRIIEISAAVLFVVLLVFFIFNLTNESGLGGDKILKKEGGITEEVITGEKAGKITVGEVQAGEQEKPAVLADNEITLDADYIGSGGGASDKVEPEIEPVEVIYEDKKETNKVPAVKAKTAEKKAEKVITAKLDQKAKITKASVDVKKDIKKTLNKKSKNNTDFYSIQTGSFNNFKSAMSFADKLSAKGYKAYVKNGVVKGKEWFRVKVGKYNDKNAALNDIAKLTALTETKPFVTDYGK